MPTPVHRIEVQRLLAEERALLVEVLPPEEFEEEHLPDAISIRSSNSTGRPPASSITTGR